MIIHARGGERARLLSWPRPYEQNPYLGRLADALAGERVTTITHRYLAVLSAAPHGARWLHLHWPEWMTRDSSRSKASARARWLFGLLDTIRARGIRIAWTAHNLVGHDEPHFDLAIAARRALLDRCDVVFGHFASAEKDVRTLGFRGRFALGPHPRFEASRSPSRTQARAALGYAPDELVLLAFGAIEPYKALDVLAQSFVRFAPANARLHIAGPPASRDAVGSLTRIACADARVRCELRFVSTDAAAVLYAAADAAVIAYREFYTSGAAMFALSHGVPVIGPPRHHLADWAGRSFFVPMSDAHEIGGAIANVGRLQGGVRAEARAFAAAMTWESMARVVAATLFDGDYR